MLRSPESIVVVVVVMDVVMAFVVVLKGTGVKLANTDVGAATRAEVEQTARMLLNRER